MPLCTEGIDALQVRAVAHSAFSPPAARAAPSESGSCASARKFPARVEIASSVSQPQYVVSLGAGSL